MNRDELKTLIRTEPTLRATLNEVEAQLQLAERRAEYAASTFAAEIKSLEKRRDELREKLAEIDAAQKKVAKL